MLSIVWLSQHIYESFRPDMMVFSGRYRTKIVPPVRAPQGYFLRVPALGNSRCVPALGNSRGSLRFAPLCTRTEHSLLAVVTLLTGAAECLRCVPALGTDTGGTPGAGVRWTPLSRRLRSADRAGRRDPAAQQEGGTPAVLP